MTATFSPIYTPILSRPDKAGLDLTGGGRKIVLHTTEGPANSLPFGWYGTTGYIPNYTVSLPLRQWHRHLPDDKGSYTLIDGNRWGDCVIQIEVCGHAATIDSDFTTADLVWFGETLRQLADANGVPWDFATFVAYPASYGFNAAQRFDIPTYTAFPGICGHQHVPRNDHGDLGAAPVALIKAAGLTPTPTPGDEDMPGHIVCERGHEKVNDPVYAITAYGNFHILADGYADLIRLGIMPDIPYLNPDLQTINSQIERVDRAVLVSLGCVPA